MRSLFATMPEPPPPPPVSSMLARNAASGLMSSIRDLEGRRALDAQLKETEDAKATLAEIEAVVAGIRPDVPDATRRSRLVALSRLAKAITTCASEHSLAAMGKLTEEEGLKRVHDFCMEARDDPHVLGCGLAIFANIAFQGFFHLCVDAGACTLLYTLLCPPNASTDPETVAFATSALSNLCTDPHSTVAFSNEQLTALDEAMRALLANDAYGSSHLAAHEAVGKLATTLETR